MCSPEQLTKWCPEKLSLMFSEQFKLWGVIAFSRKRRAPRDIHCFATFEAGMPRGTHQIYVTQCRSEPSIINGNLISYKLIRENFHLQLWGGVVHQTTSPAKLVINAEWQLLRADSTDKEGNNHARPPKVARPRLQWEETDISVNLTFSLPACKQWRQTKDWEESKFSGCWFLNVDFVYCYFDKSVYQI